MPIYFNIRIVVPTFIGMELKLTDGIFVKNAMLLLQLG